jgi:hypothetical protein
MLCGVWWQPALQEVPDVLTNTPLQALVVVADAARSLPASLTVIRQLVHTPGLVHDVQQVWF